MIHIVRGAEPPSLAVARTERLSHAVAAYNDKGAPSEALSKVLTGYDVRDVKKTLYDGQLKKCAYCERRRDFSSSPIEHFRPKDGALRHRRGEPARESKGHYWWLTWTWENLFFACPRCNDAGHKGNYFLLEEGTNEVEVLVRPAAVESAGVVDHSAERPLLLDPASDVFLDHVRWEPAETHLARNLWIWSPMPLTERGRATIEILKLAELADDFQHHLKTSVLPKLEEVERHLHGRRTRQVAESWRGLLQLLEPENDFTAATWCALERWAAPDWIAENKLAPLVRPT